MFRHCGSLCLLVLMGVLVASCSPVPPCRFISERLKRTHESVVELLDLKQPDIGSNPPFRSVIKNINISCQRKEQVLLNATLDVYLRIFSSILQQNQNHMKSRTPTLLDQLPPHKRSQVESGLMELKGMMEMLKKELSHQCQDREDRVLDELANIRVDDSLVQRQALAQFKEVYQAASVIGYRHCGHHAHSSQAD